MKQCTFKITFNYTNAFFKTFDIVADHLIYYSSQSHVPITQAKEAILKVQQVIEQHPQAPSVLSIHSTQQFFHCRCQCHCHRHCQPLPALAF